MLSNLTMFRYIIYVAMAVFFSALFNKFFPEYTFVNPTFLLVCGILGEVLGWKYDYTNDKDEN